MKSIPAAILLLLLTACRNDTPDNAGPDRRPALIRDTETAHHKNDFLARETVSFDLELHRRGRPSLQASVLQRTDGTRIRIRKANGSDVLFDGTAGWLAPAGRVTRLPCTAREDLAHQAALTDLLFRVRPVYQARMLTVAASLLDRLEQAAACPIWFASCGPTHEAVKVCWRQCEVTV